LTSVTAENEEGNWLI